MDEEFVADSEGESGLALSPALSPLKVIDASFDTLHARNGVLFIHIEFQHLSFHLAQPSAKSYSPSSISQYPSTINPTAVPLLDSPIVEFTASTRPLTYGKPVPKKTVNRVPVIELSDFDDDPPPKPIARKPKAALSKKSAKEGKKGKKVAESSIMNDDDDFSAIEFGEVMPVPKKRKSIVKKKLDDDEGSYL